MQLAHLVPLVLFASLLGQEPYRRPPEPIARCIEAQPPPSVGVDPSRQHLLLASGDPMPSIEVLARPILALAGRRIDPTTRGPQQGGRGTGFELVRIADGTRRKVALPADCDVGGPVWAADGSRFAFTNTTADRIELWIAEVATATCKRIDGVRLCGTLGPSVRWLPDQKQLLCLTVANEGPAPAAPLAPAGPVVDQSAGKKAPVRTYQDLLQNEHDARLFEHYMTAQLVRVDPAGGTVTKIGAPAIYSGCDSSADGRFLLVTQIKRPFSYQVGAESFPKVVAVWDKDGKPVATIAELPVQDQVPIGGVPAGRRGVRWQSGSDATLLWTEAQDGGDPKKKVPHRDLVLQCEAPFTQPRELVRTEHRCQGLSFGNDGQLVLVTEFDRDRRWVRTWRLTGGKLEGPVFDRSQQDAYGDPGRPLVKVDARGDGLVHVERGAIFLDGDGASQKGDRPFLDRFDVQSGKKTRLFESSAERLEQVTALLADDASSFLVSVQSRELPPNTFAVQKDGTRRALTELRDPAAELTRGIEKQRLVYKRSDGVQLTATLYLPPDRKAGEKLPMFVWAYPREFNDQGTAGQVRGSLQRYTRLSGTSPLLLVLAGYAVLDDASMPVVGPTDKANDTFVPQIVSSAQAAIDAVAALGVIDPERVAVGGHSYGAFMTANLLAHCDLFRAGIARSGAYNRTLTPFGFQNEERTLWQATDVYVRLSPFLHADKIQEPVLLIHGEKDNNPGTFTMQSQRLFAAIKGHGGHARLVLLPHESHGYRARESVLHCMAEMVEWLDAHVKNASPRAVPAEAGVSK
jgi:dipeptidyl aminopeptidase/acylaminoacyl peptidase